MKGINIAKTSALLILLTVLSVILGGCLGASGGNERNGSSVQEESEEKKLQIGLAVDSFVIERWIRDRDAFVATARELGAEVNVQDAGADPQEQISQIRYLIQKDMDVLVVIARDCNALSEVLQEAKDEGIPVISYDRLVYDGGSELYISFDNCKVGKLMAEALIDAIPDGGEIFMIQGSPDDDNVNQVKEGFDAALKDSSLEVVYTANCEGWLAEQAEQYVEDGLKKYPDVKGIMCGNDDIASQVVQTLAQNQLAGKVVVVGQDCDVAACQRIVEGTQYMTAFKDIEEEARIAAEYAVMLAKGEKPEDIREKVDDGSFQVPSLELEPVAVTAENIDEVIIGGGFHQREDVYLHANTVLSGEGNSVVTVSGEDEFYISCQ